jgi:uncharacterized C2H2 Zn-finger protein
MNIILYRCKICDEIEFTKSTHIIRHLQTIHYNPNKNENKIIELKKIITLNKMWTKKVETKLNNIDKIEYEFESLKKFDKERCNERLTNLKKNYKKHINKYNIINNN